MVNFVYLNLKGYVKNLNKSNEVESIVQGKMDNILLIIEVSTSVF